MESERERFVKLLGYFTLNINISILFIFFPDYNVVFSWLNDSAVFGTTLLAREAGVKNNI